MESSLTLPKVGLKPIDLILRSSILGPSTFSRPCPLPWSTAQNKQVGVWERERQERELEGGQKGLEWVGRVTVARQPILGSASSSTPSCTTTLHKQSFPFSRWHKPHSWEMTASRDRGNTHLHTHVHMFRQMATCAVVTKLQNSHMWNTQRHFSFNVLAQECYWHQLALHSNAAFVSPENNNKRSEYNICHEVHRHQNIHRLQQHNNMLNQYTKAPRLNKWISW